MQAEPAYEAVWPLARSTTRAVAAAARPADLAGKKVGFIWDYLFRGDQMFSIVADELAQRFPGVSFVDYPVFGNIHGADEQQVVAALPDRLRQSGVDAVVVGIGA